MTVALSEGDLSPTVHIQLVIITLNCCPDSLVPIYCIAEIYYKKFFFANQTILLSEGIFVILK